MRESFADVMKLFFVRNHVKVDCADIPVRKTTKLGSDIRITAGEVRTFRLKGQKRQKPITVVKEIAGLSGVIYPSFPALSWELRTSVSLARLWRAGGKHQQASDLLLPMRTN
jgi:hypothetical protein